MDIYLDTKENILLSRLKEYYTKEKIEIILNIINNSNPISLRIIDWFVTNYSKYNTKKIYFDKNMDIYNDYKSQLKAYNKKLFDPFCRSHNIKIISKFNFYYDKDKYIITTIGQLNFFKWAIENDLINYIHQIIEDIKIDIKLRYKPMTNKSKISNLSKNICLNNDNNIEKMKKKILDNNIKNYSITF